MAIVIYGAVLIGLLGIVLVFSGVAIDVKFKNRGKLANYITYSGYATLLLAGLLMVYSKIVLYVKVFDFIQ